MNPNDELLEKQGHIDFKDVDKKADVGIRWTSISLIYSAIIQFIIMVILARLFTPKEYGILGLILIVIGFGMTFSDAGISAAVIHYQKVSNRQLSTLYWFSFIIGLTLFVIFILVSPLISIFYNEPELTLFIQIIALVFLILPLGQQFETLLRKNLIFKSLAFIEILTSSFFLIITTILAYYGLGVISIVLGYVIRIILKSIMAFIIGLKIWKPTFEFDISEIKFFLNFGFYQMGERFLNYFNSNIDKIVIGKFLGTSSLGYYNIAYNLVIYPITLINPIFTKVSFPYFSKLQNNIKLLKMKYFNLISIISFINFPIYISLILVAPYLIPFLYGVQWYPSIILIQILSIVGLLISVGNPIGSLLLAKGFARRGFFWNLAITMMQPFIIIIGVYFGGTIEVTISILIFQLILFYFSYNFLLKKTLGPCFKEYILSFGIILLLSISSFFTSFLGGLFFQTQSDLFQLLYYILIGVVGYICLLLIFKRMFLFEFIKRFFKK